VRPEELLRSFDDGVAILRRFLLGNTHARSNNPMKAKINLFPQKDNGDCH
jgi:hypothetical protein